MTTKKKRSSKGGISKVGTKKHLTPGIENQIGAAKSLADDRAVEANQSVGAPATTQMFGEPGKEQEEFRALRLLTLKDQLKMAVVGNEKFQGMGPGLVFDVVNGRELDGQQCYLHLAALEKAYNGYYRQDEGREKPKWISYSEPIEYRTIAFPRFRSVAFQRALAEGALEPQKFRQFLRVTSRILRREFRKATRYKGAKKGMEIEMVLWHLQQGVLHCHVIIRKVDSDGTRLGLIGHNGKLVWNELELSLIAERRRRALGFLPIPQIQKSGGFIEDWRLLDRWTRSRMEGDSHKGESKRARDQGLLETWDMQVNDVVDNLFESFAIKRPQLWKLFEDEEQQARAKNRLEYDQVRKMWGLAQRDELKRLLKEAGEQAEKTGKEMNALLAKIVELESEATMQDEALRTKGVAMTKLEQVVAEQEKTRHDLNLRLKEAGERAEKAGEQIKAMLVKIKDMESEAVKQGEALRTKGAAITNLQQIVAEREKIQAGLTIDIKRLTETLGVVQAQLDSTKNKLEVAQAEAAKAELLPDISLRDTRTKIILMTDALRRVQNGIEPTKLDLYFLAPSASHLGGYCLQPAFVDECWKAAQIMTTAKDAVELVQLIKFGSFVSFKNAYAALSKQMNKQRLTPAEALQFDPDGTLKSKIQDIAEHILTIVPATKDVNILQWWKERQSEALELLSAVKLFGQMIDSPDTKSPDLNTEMPK